MRAAAVPVIGLAGAEGGEVFVVIVMPFGSVGANATQRHLRDAIAFAHDRKPKEFRTFLGSMAVDFPPHLRSSVPASD